MMTPKEGEKEWEFFRKLARAIIDDIQNRERHRIGGRVRDEFEDIIGCDNIQQWSDILHNRTKKNGD